MESADNSKWEILAMRKSHENGIENLRRFWPVHLRSLGVSEAGKCLRFAKTIALEIEVQTEVRVVSTGRMV